LTIGWMAMWKPLEILLYDRRPSLVERRLFDRSSAVKVRVVVDKPRSPDDPDEQSFRVDTSQCTSHRRLK
jgi:hypothetical protein